MKCTWERVGECGLLGWHAVKCLRCGSEAKLPDGIDYEAVGSLCNALPAVSRVGSWLAIWIEANRLDRAWYWLRARIGFRGQCGCAKREAKLNTLGQYLYSLPARIAQRLRRSCQSKGDG
jgi:hypothetical protein